jgi:hypothetical protein
LYDLLRISFSFVQKQPAEVFVFILLHAPRLFRRAQYFGVRCSVFLVRYSHSSLIQLMPSGSRRARLLHFRGPWTVDCGLPLPAVSLTTQLAFVSHSNQRPPPFSTPQICRIIRSTPNRCPIYAALCAIMLIYAHKYTLMPLHAQLRLITCVRQNSCHFLR